jgi:uncharacterized protein with GYD domain
VPKYLLQATYTAEGAKGLAREGGSKRRAQVEEMLKRLGGRLDDFYYAFGESDVYLIAEVPDAVSAAAISLAVNESGAVHCKTTVLITPEEMDQATKKAVAYRPPGG